MSGYYVEQRWCSEHKATWFAVMLGGAIVLDFLPSAMIAAKIARSYDLKGGA